jgi:predicted lipase
VFQDEKPSVDSTDVYQGFSFSKDNIYDMAYSPNFLELMSKQAVGVVMKVHSHELREKASPIEKDILFPEFYHEFADYLGFELTQA